MTAARVPVIIPVKALQNAKQRLACVLTKDERRQLVLAMLADMFDTLAEVPSVGPMLVVTPDPEVARLVRARGGVVLNELMAAGLDAAVRRGLADESVQAAGQALVLPGDVPLASAGEIAKLADGSARRGCPRVTLVPARDGDGTNAMLLSPPGVIDPSFGRGSFVRHLAAAVARRVDAEVLQMEGIANDVDAPADLDRLLRERRRSRRYEFLRGRSTLEVRLTLTAREDRR
ncbi:MAG: 2-phospho-L-lactate guanylyltransferase [Hyphomicrobiaceae bacterium]|nr:2-phospho-L-lactate guanylyltransferase [Hyphomicrobiaceae bacterium]